ncbi:MAG: hypothetical protein NVSMB9_01090 [Isosphaeraceae bacterium]
MRRAIDTQGQLIALLSAAACCFGTGCTHNYYYGASPCGPSAGVPRTVEYGALCEVPSQVVGGSTVIATAPRNTQQPPLKGPRPPRIVLSEPHGAPGLAWRRADPDGGPATTRIEGAADDPTLTR